MVMIVISVAVRFWQEYQSGIAVFLLQSSIVPKIRVRRPATKTDGLQTSWTEETTTDSSLVPGDVVVLVPGAIVPADCLILDSSYLRISQSAWTGESEPVLKEVSPPNAKEAFSIFDYGNVALMGTNIVSGHGVGLVLRTGDGEYQLHQ
jgi:Mg2+-importing ATPase